MNAAVRGFEAIGRRSAGFFDQIGYGSTLLAASIYWLLVGWRRRQPVRIRMIFHEMQQIGVAALPIATLLSGTIGLMLAIQSLYSLGLFGAEAYAYIGIALSVAREFSPLIMAILVAGRSGSAIAARLEVGTAWVNQHRTTSAVVPFGGAKESGLGRQYSALGLKSYMEPEVVSVAKR